MRTNQRGYDQRRPLTIMPGAGHRVEIRSTAEGAPFTGEQFAAPATLARHGIRGLLTWWEK
jgi:ribonuclease PH